ELLDSTCCWRQWAWAVVVAAVARDPAAEAQAVTVAAELEAAACPGRVDREGLPAGVESEERARIRQALGFQVRPVADWVPAMPERAQEEAASGLAPGEAAWALG